MERVRSLTDENLRQQEMLKRHQERWQRVRDEYAKKKGAQGGGGDLQEEPGEGAL